MSIQKLDRHSIRVTKYLHETDPLNCRTHCYYESVKDNCVCVEMVAWLMEV